MPRFVITFNVNHEADSELRAQCLNRGFEDVVTSEGRKWRLPNDTLLTIAPDLATVDKVFDKAVIATKGEMAKQKKLFRLEKVYITNCGPGMFVSDEECVI
jgi:hypothetical protein